MKKVLVFIFFLLVFFLGCLLSIPKKINNSKKKPALKTKEAGLKNMINIKSVFENNQTIPTQYTCDGENINPPLTISNIPQNTKSLVLIIDDPDAPSGIWNHWLVWNISPQTSQIEKDSTPKDATVGTNDFGNTNYDGPCPPSGAHRYFFKIFALDTILNLPSSAKRNELDNAIKNHILDKGEVIGIYTR